METSKMSRKGTVFNIGDPVVVVDDTIRSVEHVGRRGRIDVANGYTDIVRVVFESSSAWFEAAWFEDAELEIDEQHLDK